MNKRPDTTYTEKMLREAMELLADTHLNMGMFQRQRYYKLKNRVEQHLSITGVLQTALNNIETD